jgi:hypothetical protein
MSSIVISYRRADAAAIAGRIADELSRRFSREDVFIDIDKIPTGKDFREVIADALRNAAVIVVVIGPNWLGRREAGEARIMERTDPVRVEVETAMKQRLPLIPVLVDGGTMPGEGDLPRTLRKLPYYNACRVDSGVDFATHMDRLTRVLEAIVKPRPDGPAVAASAPAPVTAPKTDLSGDPYRDAATALIGTVLFRDLPHTFRDGIVHAIVERLERATNRNDDLVRAARLFVEWRLLHPETKDGEATSLEGGTAAAVVSKLEPQIDGVLNRRNFTPEPITFETCFELFTLLDEGGATYLSTLDDLDRTPVPPRVQLRDADRFLTPFTVQDGFVAPTFLVAGLLQQFETQWPLALESFDTQLGGHGDDFALLQRFELYCWLMWGPSIPACTCEGWNGKFIVLQYGYGDEANSVPLLLDGPTLRAWPHMLREKFAELDTARGSDAPLPLAFAAEVTGTLVWGPSYEPSGRDYPGVYTVAATERDATRLRDGEATILRGPLLRADSIGWLVQRRQYYSAYMWVMFEVCREGEASPGDPRDRWRRLLPIFEHANIADGDTLLFLKRRLAEKACRTVADIERAQQGRVRLRYLCATDDPGTLRPDEHGAHLFRFRPDARTMPPLRDEVFGHGATPTIDELLSRMGPYERRQLRSIMYEELADDESRARMFAPAADPSDVITACDLPQILEDFYNRFIHAAGRK